MATRTWSATSTATDYSTAGNWSGGSAPTGDDIVVFDDTSQNNVDAGLAQTGVDLQRFIVTSGYGGTLGGSGSALAIAVSNTLTSSGRNVFLRYAGLGTSYIGGGTIDNAYIDSAPAGFYCVSGTWANLEITRGRVVIQASAVVTALVVLGGEVIIADNGTAITSIEQTGGVIVCNDRDVTTWNVSGGRSVTNGDTAITTLNNRGGLFNYKSSGTLATLNNYKGVWTPQGSVQNITVTNANVYAGSRFVDKASGVSVTIGTETQLGDGSRDDFIL